jgi:cell division initiation protein
VPLAPDQVRQYELKRGRGYKRDEVDALLASVVASYEEVWKERATFGARIEELESKLASYGELEQHLGDAIVTAHQAAEQLRVQAERDAAETLEQGKRQATELVRKAQEERDRLTEDVARLRALDHDLRTSYRAFLVAALELAGTADAAGDDAPLGELPDLTKRAFPPDESTAPAESSRGASRARG